MGPSTVTRDRIDYIGAISDSWKQQMLLNLLKVRYSDAPVFLDVTSVINAYALEGDVTLAGQAAPVGRGDTFLGASGTRRYSDHPTITYAPLVGDKFAKSIMSPVPVSGILLLVQSGYPADFVLRVCVSTVNGLENAFGGPNPRSGDPRFHELLELMREDQKAGGLGFAAKPGTGKRSMAMMLRAPRDTPMAARHRRIVELLGLKADAREFDVGYGSFPDDDMEIALISRSILQVMIDVASHIDTPAVHVAEGRVHVPPRTAEDERMFPALVRVHSAAQEPKDAYAAVRYRDHWFWIDDRDPRSKSGFSFLMLLFSLTETASTQAAPVVTVPAR